MSRLADGTVIPHFLDIQPAGFRGGSGNQSNLSLRWGEVVTLVPPSDPKNFNKKWTEYIVRVPHKDGGETGAQIYYTSVQLSNLFGGVADYLTYTLRPAPVKAAPPNGLPGLGSKVLLLCVNGDTHQAVILGGLNDGQNTLTVDDPVNKGHNLDFNFNGLNVVINDDGSLQVIFNGKTNIDGTLNDGADEAAQGSNIRMSADGSIQVTSPDALQHVLIDNSNHLVEIDADQELDVNCTGNVVIQSAGVLTGGATDATMKGTTYRLNETIMDTTLEALCVALNTSLLVASTTLTAAGAALTSAGGTLAIPSVGPMLAAPQLTAAGAAVTAAGAALTAAAAAYDAWNVALVVFEQTDELTPYLSSSNFSD